MAEDKRVNTGRIIGTEYPEPPVEHAKALSSGAAAAKANVKPVSQKHGAGVAR